MEIYEFGALIISIVLSCVGLVIVADIMRENYEERQKRKAWREYLSGNRWPAKERDDD